MPANFNILTTVNIQDGSAGDIDRASRGNVGKGTVFVRSFVLKELGARDKPNVRGSWIAFGNKEELKKRLIDARTSFSAGKLIESGAFGCDSRVFDRAVDRALQHASDNGIDLLEIMEVVERHDSGIDHVEILARGSRTRLPSFDDHTGSGRGSSISS